MTLLLAVTGWQERPWLDRFRALLPDRDVISMNAAFEPASIAYVAAWKPPVGLLATLPNLKAILYLGAGVDHVLADESLPSVPLVRVVDHDLTTRMSEWVVMNCLMQLRGANAMRIAQNERLWLDQDDPPPASKVRVGMMGLGVLGRDAATKLRIMGFDVAGWSRTPKQVDGLQTYAGEQSLDAFLARTEILVVLLPLTPETRGCLDTALFARLARDGRLGGPILINAGRGGLQVETDILACLDAGLLQHAVLDVFETEPLPALSPLWLHPHVTITPHNSAGSDPEAVAAYVVRQLRLHEAGQPMETIVNRERGY